MKKLASALALAFLATAATPVFACPDHGGAKSDTTATQTADATGKKTTTTTKAKSKAKAETKAKASKAKAPAKPTAVSSN